jgi:hypothetical protein
VACPAVHTIDTRQVCGGAGQRIGLQAAKAAGMTCVVTKRSYTQGENFSSADGVCGALQGAGDWRQWLGPPARWRRAARDTATS